MFQISQLHKNIRSYANIILEILSYIRRQGNFEYTVRKKMIFSIPGQV